MNAWFKKSIWTLIVCMVGFGGLACNSKSVDESRPQIYATISADGKVIAALSNPYTSKARLRIMYLDKPNQWQDLKIPAKTSSARFGLQGHELLVTHNTDEGAQAVLSKIDLGQPAAGL